jgi:demethylmenaquinone methyltransferase/2-methoxy-6-polyprenyl-1,4-benzoquinol methylase
LDSTFDSATVTFGIRNVRDPLTALRELRRVLVPGGRLIILEFSHPSWPRLRSAYFAYLKRVLPWVGGLLSGYPAAYRYLGETIRAFPSGEAFCTLLREAGFLSATHHPLTLGVVSIYTGEA